MIALHLALIGILSVAMGWTANQISVSVRVIAKDLGFSDFLVAFVFLGFATSLPEISVAVFSAIEGRPGLSLGNLLGANIVALSLLCGLAVVIAKRLSPSEFYKNRTLPLFLLEVILPVYAVADGRLTRVDGVFLTLAHVAFIGHVYRNHRRSLDAEPLLEETRVALRRPVAIAIGGTTALLGASYLLVNSALAVADTLGVSALIVGLVLFSLGTNIPELAFVLTQSRKNNDIVLGDVFGSVLLNTPTLGLLALISPFTIGDTAAVLASGVALVLLAALFGVFMWTGKALERREGWWLLGAYVAFLAYHISSQ